MALLDTRTIGGRLALARGERFIGEGLRTSRVSQAQLAEAVGVHRVTISDWERSPQADISSKHLVAICNFLNVEATWLLTGQGPMRPSPESGKSYYVAIDERLGAIRGALGLVLPAGHEGTRDLDDFATIASYVGELGGCLFDIDQSFQGLHGGRSSIALAIKISHGLSFYDREFAAYLMSRFLEIAELMDEAENLWIQWKNGELDLECEDPDKVTADDILKLPAPDKLQIVPRFTPSDPSKLEPRFKIQQ